MVFKKFREKILTSCCKKNMFSSLLVFFFFSILLLLFSLSNLKHNNNNSNKNVLITRILWNFNRLHIQVLFQISRKICIFNSENMSRSREKACWNSSRISVFAEIFSDLTFFEILFVQTFRHFRRWCNYGLPWCYKWLCRNIEILNNLDNRK